MAQYMNCGTDDERSDFFAFNDYSWCDPSSFTTSGWDQKVKNFTGYGLPLFLSEYGCNTNKRKFEEVAALYDEKMTGVYSGGLVYEYSQESSNYGLVKVSSDSVKTLDDFDALKSAFDKTDNPSGSGGYNKTGGANPCPAKDSPNWNVDDDDLPSIPEPAKKYMTEGAGKGDGFKGKGSQNAGTTSTGTAKPGSGSASSSYDSSSDSSSTSSSSAGAAAGLQIPSLTLAPVVVGLVTVASTLFGAGMVLV
ncbi:1,3-beta-glucanosyltransferase [Aspergillus melleus]|uniref:1,3-beta-glucanosyltransferase n=1 Tax=Aspergillus melleus TaxID=138277 RepID=A0ACC3BEW0_9EURO|nr:1,3-beta-glucanosyltransferase [Aspergillus melleus]